jgi:hypothetical protein
MEQQQQDGAGAKATKARRQLTLPLLFFVMCTGIFLYHRIQ